MERLEFGRTLIQLVKQDLLLPQLAKAMLKTLLEELQQTLEQVTSHSVISELTLEKAGQFFHIATRL